MSEQETSIISPNETSVDIHDEAEIVKTKKGKTLVHSLTELPKPRKRRRRPPAAW